MAVPGYAYLSVGAAMLAAAVLTILAGRRNRAREGRYNAEALGFVGGVFNALFIVVLAFYTVIAWTEADATAQHTADEASGLTELYWQAANLPVSDRDQVRALIREYTTEVAEREWPELGEGRSDPKAEDLLIALRAELNRIPTGIEDLKSTRDQGLQTIRSITDDRQARVEAATDHNVLLTLLLLGTIIGAAAMIGYPLLMGFSADLRHITSLALLAGVLAFVVYFAIELDHPFSGLVRIEPDPFRAALTDYARIP